MKGVEAPYESTKPRQNSFGVLEGSFRKPRKALIVKSQTTKENSIPMIWPAKW
jgi:hypothetical protein